MGNAKKALLRGSAFLVAVEVNAAVEVSQGGGGDLFVKFIEFQKIDVVFVPDLLCNILDGEVGGKQKIPRPVDLCLNDGLLQPRKPGLPEQTGKIVLVVMKVGSNVIGGDVFVGIDAYPLANLIHQRQVRLVGALQVLNVDLKQNQPQNQVGSGGRIPGVLL